MKLNTQGKGQSQAQRTAQGLVTQYARTVFLHITC